jgi:hypothetical protein
MDERPLMSIFTKIERSVAVAECPNNAPQVPPRNFEANECTVSKANSLFMLTSARVSLYVL